MGIKTVTEHWAVVAVDAVRTIVERPARISTKSCKVQLKSRSSHDNSNRNSFNNDRGLTEPCLCRSTAPAA